jgi:hypothetical protein
LNQEHINNINTSFTNNKVEVAIKSLPTKKSSGLDRFTAEFYQAFKEELLPMFLKLFHKIERERMLSNLF